MKRTKAIVLGLCMALSASVSAQEMAFAQVGHSDGWDDTGKWIGVNIYEVLIEQNDGVAIGHFGVNNPEKIEHIKINWRSAPDRQSLSVNLKDYEYITSRLGKNDDVNINTYRSLKDKQKYEEYLLKYRTVK